MLAYKNKIGKKHPHMTIMAPYNSGQMKEIDVCIGIDKGLSLNAKCFAPTLSGWHYNTLYCFKLNL
jgi:hypothetical protein